MAYLLLASIPSDPFMRVIEVREVAIMTVSNKSLSIDAKGSEIFFRKNVHTISLRWPRLWDRIKRTRKPERVWLSQSKPQATLCIDGIHLSSGYDQISEARLQSSLVPEGSLFAWVYGFGVGQVPRILLQRHEMRRLVVMIMNPAVAIQSFRYFDHSDWLSDPRVELALGEDEEDIYYPFAAVPSCLQLVSTGASRIRDLVFLELSTPYSQRRYRDLDVDMNKRIMENLDLIKSDGDVTELFESAQGKRVLIAAAGPSLASHYEWFLTQGREFILISVDAALKPLVEAGILPDIVVTMDPSREGVYPLFSNVSLSVLSDRTLVYFPLVHKDVLNLWQGRRLTSYTTSTIYGRVRKKYPRGTLYSSGSVLHPSVDLAVKMGATTIVLFGADFSFPEGNSHVKGSPAALDEIDKSHWVLSGNGTKVPTTANLRGYLRDLERYIGKTPGVQFVNAGREGAHIKGVLYPEEFE